MLNRRKNRQNQTICWDSLNLVQKFGASPLLKFGYQLAFIRSTEEGSLAIFLREQEIATIDEEGEIDLEPKITLREAATKKTCAQIKESALLDS